MQKKNDIHCRLYRHKQEDVRLIGRLRRRVIIQEIMPRWHTAGLSQPTSLREHGIEKLSQGCSPCPLPRIRCMQCKGSLEQGCRARLLEVVLPREGDHKIPGRADALDNRLPPVPVQRALRVAGRADRPRRRRLPRQRGLLLRRPDLQRHLRMPARTRRFLTCCTCQAWRL